MQGCKTVSVIEKDRGLLPACVPAESTALTLTWVLYTPGWSPLVLTPTAMLAC